MLVIPAVSLRHRACIYRLQRTREKGAVCARSAVGGSSFGVQTALLMLKGRVPEARGKSRGSRGKRGEEDNCRRRPKCSRHKCRRNQTQKTRPRKRGQRAGSVTFWKPPRMPSSKWT